MASPAESAEDVENADKGREDEDALGTQSTIDAVGPCKRRIKAEVPKEKVEEQLDRNYRELISSVQIPGFRRGHVPRRLLEKRYGGEIEGDVKEVLLGLSFAEVVKEKELKVLGKPKFENLAFQKGEPFRYEAEVEVQPEFELRDYQGVEVEGETLAPVDPEEVEAQLQRLREQHPELTPIDPDAAGPEDIFIGHYTLRRDGLKLHLQEDVRFRPSAKNIDGFEIPDLPERVQSRGTSPTFSARVKVPDSYSQEALRGSELDFEFGIEETKRVQLPEANDELAKRFDVPSLAELRGRIEKQLEARNRRSFEEKLELKVLDRIAEGVQFDLPEGILDHQFQLARLKVQVSLAQNGFTRERIEEELKKIDEKAVGEEIRRDFKRHCILEKIAEAEKVFATEDEVNLRVYLLAQAYGRPVQEVMEELQESEKIEMLRSEIRHQKTRKLLCEKARITGGTPLRPAAPPAVLSPLRPPEGTQLSPLGPPEGTQPSPLAPPEGAAEPSPSLGAGAPEGAGGAAEAADVPAAGVEETGKAPGAGG